MRVDGSLPPPAGYGLSADQAATGDSTERQTSLFADGQLGTGTAAPGTPGAKAVAR